MQGNVVNGHRAGGILSHGMQRPVRVVLADGQELMREGLAALLSAQPRFEVVGTTGDGHGCLRLCVDQQPDLLVFDDMMPGLAGIEAARRVAAHCPATRMLCLADTGDKPCVRAAFDAGVHGYVLKRCTLAHLIDGIDDVLSARHHVSPGLAHVLIDDTRAGGMQGALSTREREVAGLYAKGLSTRQIAGALHISMKTVGTHREHILAKLDGESVADITRYALREGLASLDP
jgi:DNA-binding NarL/FixJ family response regulator